MRHGAALIMSMEGMSRHAFRIARELAQNSRAGLTLRFLSKKLDLSHEEIEYLIDLHDKLFFFDLTRVRLVAEGVGAVQRVCAGLENHGDVPSLMRSIKSLDSYQFRRLEEVLNVSSPSSRTAVTQTLLEKFYRHPDSVVEYVAQRGFSKTAQEVFDMVWQSPTGIVPVSAIRSARRRADFETEQALTELFQGYALFELFRFDADDKLVRVAALLSELRQLREVQSQNDSVRQRPRALKRPSFTVFSRGMDFSDRVCRLVAAIAAHPVRIRSNGELFREDSKRLSEICGEEEDPSLATCLWAAQSVNWLARVDNEIHANDVGSLLQLDRLARHRVLFDWFMSLPNEQDAKVTLGLLLEEMGKANAWYKLTEFVRWASQVSATRDVPVLRNVGGHWGYVSPSLSPHFEKNLVHSLEETLFWLGVVDRGESDGDSFFRVSELGFYLLKGELSGELKTAAAPSKGEIVVQPNFEIVVPTQGVDPLLTVPLEQFADPISRSNVIVYRLTKAAFTRALQLGYDGTAFVHFLVTHNRGGEIPPNVLTTLQDWCGSAKRVRLHTLHVMECEDPLVLADIASRRSLKKYLRAIDPARTMSYEKITRTELVKELQKEGFIVE